MTTSTSEWLDQFFALYYRSNPVSATFIGVHDLDGQLPDYSPGAIAGQLADIRNLLDQLDTGQVAPPTTQWEAVDRLLAGNYLQTQIWELSDRVLLDNPCLYTGEAAFGVISLFLRDYSPVSERASAAVQRMQQVPDFLALGRANLTSCPTAWVDRAVDECDGAFKLLTEGIEILVARHGIDQPEFRSAATGAAGAFREFRQHLIDDVRPAAHDSYGVGAVAFDMLLDLGHCLNMNHQEVADYAGGRLEEARAAMADIAAGIDPSADPATLLAGLRDIHPTVDGYYPSYQEEWNSVREHAIERELLSWPDYPIEFEPIPDWARAAAPHLYFLFYRAPAPFDRHVIQRYLMTPIEADMPLETQQQLLRSVNLSQIRLNHIIHHGGIGHHVQNWWAYHGESRIGQVAAVDCSLRIAMLCGGTMAEGWACYSVDLMNESGYLTPLEQLSEQQGLARMAARAIVDAGLHSQELTFDDAIRFYRDEASMSEAAARAEVIKNSMFPGAAMMYLIGTDMIHELRKELQERQGSDFSLSRFHDEFLSHGSIPVSITSRMMKGEEIAGGRYSAPVPV